MIKVTNKLSKLKGVNYMRWTSCKCRTCKYYSNNFEDLIECVFCKYGHKICTIERLILNSRYEAKENLDNESY